MWVRELFPKALWIDLLDPESARLLQSRPERLRELVDGSPGKPQVVIDEVQKVPELLGVVHALIEERKGLQFILTGSSARKLKRSGIDLLSGRALLKTLHPFLAEELGERFSLPESLRRGLLPLVLGSEDPPEAMKAYISLYLREEVQMEGLVRNLGGFGRFLEAISFSHAAFLNLSNISRECEVERKTVEGFVQILEDLLLGFKVPVFTRRAKRDTSSHPKFYLFDPGIYHSLRPRGPLDRPEEAEGAALEGLVVQHLRAWNSYRGEPNKLFCWRTRSGVEVDAILYGEDGFWAIEVKNSRKIHPIDVRSLKAFNEDYPESEPLLIYRGAKRLKVEGILCIPCDEFLRGIHPGRKTISPPG